MGRLGDNVVSIFLKMTLKRVIKYERAVDCLTKDRDALLAFYDFPAEHWKHLRTTNPIEPKSGSWMIARWRRIGRNHRDGDGEDEFGGSPRG